MYFKRIAQLRTHRRTIFIHIIFWSLFIFYELVFLYLAGGKLDPAYIYIYYYAVNICFFYLQIGVVNFTFNREQRRYLEGLVLFLLLVAGNFLIRILLVYFIEGHWIMSMSRAQKNTFFVTNVYRMFYFTMLAALYSRADHIAYYRKQSLLAEKKRMESEREKSITEIRLAETQNAYLQQQMTPHMLFNTLSFIYSGVQRVSPALSKSVLLLSDIMRFNLDGPGPDGKIQLAEEITQIYNLAEINKARFSQGIYLDITITGGIDDYRIIPLVLFTLTENVFKHGYLVDSLSPATLNIDVNDEGQLTYRSKNRKRPENNFKRLRSIGIQNIRTRMDFAYGGKYRLDLVDSADYFETNLSVSL